MEITVLGSATPYPTADNPCSGYLLSTVNSRLWVDAGTGTLGALQRHVAVDDVDAIWVSHLHADHCADLLTAFYGLLYADVDLDAPIPLYGPPGIADRLAGFLTNSATRSPVESAFAVHELHDGHRAEVGDMTLTTRAVEHGMPAFALRVEVDDNALVYSGDTAPCANLTGLAEGCDLLLCEAEGTPDVHHTPEQAGATAGAAGVGRLVLTHVGRAVTHPMERAAAEYGGPVGQAAPGRRFTV